MSKLGLTINGVDIVISDAETAFYWLLPTSARLSFYGGCCCVGCEELHKKFADKMPEAVKLRIQKLKDYYAKLRT